MQNMLQAPYMQAMMQSLTANPELANQVTNHTYVLQQKKENKKNSKGRHKNISLFHDFCY